MKINIKQNSVKLLIAAGMVVGTASISAAAEMDISATVGEACMVTVPSGLDFGDYDGIIDNATDALVASFSVNAHCSLDTSGVINIDPGQNASNSDTALPARTMKMENVAGTYNLNYNLYKDSGYSNIWGAGTLVDVGSGNPHTGTGSSEVVSGFAEIPAGQIVPIGIYQDTVIVTVLY